jgi:hypothetical protein
VSARRRGRSLAGLPAVLLLLTSCGHSSSTKSIQPSTGKSAPKTSASRSTSQRSAQSTPSASGTVTGSSGGVTASLHAVTHHPTVGRPWPIHFTVTRGGRPVKASVSYEYLYGGQVVARRSHYTFTGRFSDIFVWPAAAIGYPLTLRAVIVSEGVTINLDYSVQVTT